MSASWEAHRFSPDEAFERTLLGLTPELAARWATYDLPFEEIEEWVTNGFVDPLDAYDWLMNGFDADEATQLEGEGYTADSARAREEAEWDDDGGDWDDQ